MDSVRFSIIKEKLLHIDDDDDIIIDDNLTDSKSISSESSMEGLPVSSPISLSNDNSTNTHFFINDSMDVDNRPNHCMDELLKDLPNAEQILNVLNEGDLNVIIIGSEDVNTALLLSIFMGRNDYVYALVSNYYADVNTADSKGRTALHWSCTFSNQCVTKLLLNYGAEMNQWENGKKLTPLHCAANAGSLECIELLLKNGVQVNAGIEKRSALHMAIEKNFIKCVEILLKNGANPNTPQVYTETPLHTAAGLGNKECIELLLKYGADVRSQFGKRRLTALHLAAEDDYIECVRLLLENGAKVDARNVDNQTPLHLACLSQCVETTELLLKHNADVNAIYKDGRTALHAAIVKESKCFECARLLLKAGVDVNKPDNYGYTPLHIAALNEFSTCAYMLIEYGADITARTFGGITALSFIVRRTPEVIPKFLQKFDTSIKVNDHEIGDVDCEIKLDFKLLVPSTERGETELLLAFIEVGQKRILKHPLCETFLFLKWRRIRKFFLFSLFYHSVYVLMFTLYILGVYDKDCPADSEHIHKVICQVPAYVPPVGYIVVFLNLLLMAKEFFQMGHSFAGYVKYWENWVQWAIMIGVFLCATPSGLISNDLTSVPDWQYHVAAIVIFLVWLELMMLVGRFPIFGLYVQMFTKVAVNFAKFLLAYCCLLIAFGLSFGVLFANYPAFQSVPWSLLKTVTMMAGELEFEDIFYNSDVPIEYPVTAHGMFFTFVLLVTVILTNLLVGLAVSDIQGLQASAGLDRLSRQAELVSRLESLFFSRLLRKAPPSIILMCQRSALLRTSRYHLQFCIRPNDPRDKRLPKDLVVSIYKLVAERRDRNQSLKRRKREQNLTYFARSYDHPSNSSYDGGGGGVRIRNHSSHIAGPRHSDNSSYTTNNNNNRINLAPPTTLPPIPTPQQQNFNEFNRNVEQLNIKLLDICCKLNKLNETQDVFSRQIEDLSKEIGIIKNRFESNL